MAPSSPRRQVRTRRALCIQPPQNLRAIVRLADVGLTEKEKRSWRIYSSATSIRQERIHIRGYRPIHNDSFRHRTERPLKQFSQSFRSRLIRFFVFARDLN